MSRRDPDDWWEREQPLGVGLVAELQRLKRRARARWIPVLIVAIALTAAVLYKKSKKVPLKHGQVVLAVTEGAMNDGVIPMPVQELRDYILGVLLSAEAIAELIWSEDLLVDPKQRDDAASAATAEDLRTRLARLPGVVSEVECRLGRCRVTLSAGPDPGLDPALARLETPAILDDYAVGMVQGSIRRVSPQLYRARLYLGLADAPMEVWDMFDVGVFRNYFLYEYEEDAPRSARIAVVVTDKDADFAYYLAHRLADLIRAGEEQRRLDLGDALATEAGVALANANAQAAEIEALTARRQVDLARAQDAGDDGRVAALSVELGELTAKHRRAQDNIRALTTAASSDEQSAAIDRAGLGMTFEVVEEHKTPEEPGARLYFRVIQAALLFFVFLPLVSIVVGTFDPRIHDREDVERVGLPVLGHVPPFPGDRVGSLRARGVRGRRVPS